MKLQRGCCTLIVTTIKLATGCAVDDVAVAVCVAVVVVVAVCVAVVIVPVMYCMFVLFSLVDYALYQMYWGTGAGARARARAQARARASDRHAGQGV